jgi:hypothetical protein
VVGLFVGSAAIGVVVGAFFGSAVGAAAGFFVGLFVGLVVGEILVEVGSKLEMVIDDGALVGSALVGALVGSMLGPAVGRFVPLGPAVGEPGDRKVGAADGAAVFVFTLPFIDFGISNENEWLKPSDLLLKLLCPFFVSGSCRRIRSQYSFICQQEERTTRAKKSGWTNKLRMRKLAALKMIQ